MFFSALCLLCLCVSLFIFALWSPAGKGLTSLPSFVCFVCHFPIGILGRLWYLIASIPELCTLTYFSHVPDVRRPRTTVSNFKMFSFPQLDLCTPQNLFGNCSPSTREYGVYGQGLLTKANASLRICADLQRAHGACIHKVWL